MLNPRYLMGLFSAKAFLSIFNVIMDFTFFYCKDENYKISFTIYGNYVNSKP